MTDGTWYYLSSAVSLKIEMGFALPEDPHLFDYEINHRVEILSRLLTPGTSPGGKRQELPPVSIPPALILMPKTMFLTGDQQTPLRFSPARPAHTA